MKTIAGAVGVISLVFLGFSQAACAQPAIQAGQQVAEVMTAVQDQIQHFKLAQSEGEFPVSASDAAEIARNAQPGSKVLKVQLLPSGVYAVTLKDGDNVSKVMVDATTGDIS